MLVAACNSRPLLRCGQSGLSPPCRRSPQLSTSVPIQALYSAAWHPVSQRQHQRLTRSTAPIARSVTWRGSRSAETQLPEPSAFERMQYKLLTREGAGEAFVFGSFGPIAVPTWSVPKTILAWTPWILFGIHLYWWHSKQAAAIRHHCLGGKKALKIAWPAWRSTFVVPRLLYKMGERVAESRRWAAFERAVYEENGVPWRPAWTKIFDGRITMVIVRMRYRLALMCSRLESLGIKVDPVKLGLRDPRYRYLLPNGELWDAEKEAGELKKQEEGETGGMDGVEFPGSFDERMDMQEASHILGVSLNATKQDVAKAYRNLMAKNHPDIAGSPYLAIKINEARKMYTDLAETGKN